MEKGDKYGENLGCSRAFADNTWTDLISFFRNCQSEIFFDNPEEAKVVFMEHKL